MTTRQGYAGQRPSRSADAARAREIAELRKLTMLERILLALRLRERGRLLADRMAEARRGR